jgi:formyltetrahydrofolate deformylase
MIFLANCKNRVGLVSDITKIFKDFNLDIVNLQEHIERDQFFIRIKTLNDYSIDLFKEKINEFSLNNNINGGVCKNNKKLKLVLFASKELACPLEIIFGEISDLLNVEVVAVISNFKNIEEVCNKLEIPFFYTKTEKGSFHHEDVQKNILNNISYDCIALGRYMKILSEKFLLEENSPIVNIHHSFLPSFIGNTPYEMAFDRGVKRIGATSHFVTKDLDEGPIIAQSTCRVDNSSTVEEIKSLGAKVEKAVFFDAIKKISEYKTIQFGRRVVVFK